jgi:hypothetical protein
MNFTKTSLNSSTYITTIQRYGENINRVGRGRVWSSKIYNEESLLETV